MDLVDILMARALTPQVQIETAAATARQAVADAEDAITATETAISNTETAIANAEEAISAANSAQTAAEAVITELQEKIEDIEDLFPTEEDLDKKVDKFQGVANTGKSFIIDDEGYVSLATLTSDLGSNNAGKIVVIGPDGKIISGSITEQEIITALLKDSDFEVEGAVGLQIDYKNKTYIRTQEAKGLEAGAGFNGYNMFGGRMRCNVADNGIITAWCGDENYKEDGSNGQVMIYQPKFYYSRIPIEVDDATVGKIIRKELLILSDEPKTGFKLHPIFYDANGNELEYVLFGAYEASGYYTSSGTYDTTDSSNISVTMDQLASIAGAKPISGVNKQFNVTNAEIMANNRGEGWHIFNLAAVSATQMLAMVELGSLNGQETIELGISNITNSLNFNCASYTGSTSILENATGHADETINEIGGNFNTYNTNGYRAISYRGMENPWGNIWKMIGGVNITGNGGQMGGMPYICKNFNYSVTENTANYEPLGFYLPSPTDWISAMGYSSSKFDWVFMPIECSGANSYTPVGDNLWTTNNMNGINMLSVGGQWYGDRNNGLFYYAADQSSNTAARSLGTRIMFIPSKNSIYENNIDSWFQMYQGK